MITITKKPSNNIIYSVFRDNIMEGTTDCNTGNVTVEIQEFQTGSSIMVKVPVINGKFKMNIHTYVRLFFNRYDKEMFFNENIVNGLYRKRYDLISKYFVIITNSCGDIQSFDFWSGEIEKNIQKIGDMFLVEEHFERSVMKKYIRKDRVSYFIFINRTDTYNIEKSQALLSEGLWQVELGTDSNGNDNYTESQISIVSEIRNVTTNSTVTYMKKDIYYKECDGLIAYMKNAQLTYLAYSKYMGKENIERKENEHFFITAGENEEDTSRMTIPQGKKITYREEIIINVEDEIYKNAIKGLITSYRVWVKEGKTYLPARIVNGRWIYEKDIPLYFKLVLEKYIQRNE